MHKAAAYEALARELERWRLLPKQELVASVGKPACVRSVNINGENVDVEVAAHWCKEEGGAVRVTGIANGPSHWRFERLEESIVVPSSLHELGDKHA
jgi:hypothetical protein